MAVVLFLLFVIAAPGFAQTAASYSKAATEFARQQSWDQAIADYRKALELEANDPLTRYNLALALKYKGEARDAAVEFQAALRLKPKWADAHYALGATYYDLHDQGAAIKELHTAVALTPTNAAPRLLLARIYEEQNDFASAKAELQRALALKPSAEIYTELGATEGQLGNLPAAAADFRRALKLDPKLTNAYTMLGVTLRRQDDHAGALTLFRKAVSFGAGDPQAQFNLGM